MKNKTKTQSGQKGGVGSEKETCVRADVVMLWECCTLISHLLWLILSVVSQELQNQLSKLQEELETEKSKWVEFVFKPLSVT